VKEILTNIAKLPELRARVVFTLGILAVYRLCVFVTTPGVDIQVMREVMQGSGGLLGLANMFSGGAIEQMSVIALGIMPYVSASIIIQLLAVVVPSLEKLQKEGEQGRKKINQYTRYGTVVLALIQGMGIAYYLENLGTQYAGLVADPGWSFRLLTVLALTTGTAFLMWLGEQITESGIGNGISMIIFAGIVSGLPGGLKSVADSYSRGDLDPITLLLLLGTVLLVVAAIVFFERAQRRIPVQYAKRVSGRKVYAGSTSFLPLKLNMAGVIPPIFASSILIFPATLAGYFPDSEVAVAIQSALNSQDWRYHVVYVLLIVFFAFFYTAVTFNPVDVADNLNRQHSFVPGIRPGKKTAEYIDYVMTRITFVGALYISAVCVLPALMASRFPGAEGFAYGGTSLLIVVSVGLETVQQIEGHMLSKQYEGIAERGSRIRDRVSGDETGA
jgi:preprotein translocase subunit SecY